MKVGIIVKPLFLERPGGLQTQVLETINALKILGVEVALISAGDNHLDELNCIHVFDSEGTEDAVRWSKTLGKPVVLSPVMAPTWTRWKAFKAELSERFVRWFTNGRVRTTFGIEQSAIKSADRVIALSNAEREVLASTFEAPRDRLRVIPNGVNNVFFQANPNLFPEKYGIDPGFVLCVGSIYRYKNQLALAEALQGTGRRLVLIGPELNPSDGYLRMITRLPNVVHAGVIPSNDPLLASAYASAGALAVPSLSEVFPLVVLESLAAGTPVVLTKNTALDVEEILRHVTLIDPSRPEKMRISIEKALSAPTDRAKLSATVENYKWANVGSSLVKVYREIS